jgi:hypothetical protein
MPQAKLSGFGEHGLYDCKYEWPDCYLQGGNKGIVLSKNGTYQTAFFEAFPKEPKTFIRGEGKTIEEAEKDAWEKYQKIINCTNHEFERRGYTNGVGFCKYCDLQKSDAFEPEQYCEICGTPTNWAVSKANKWYCQEHQDQIPEEEKFSWQKKKDMNPLELLFRVINS